MYCKSNLVRLCQPRFNDRPASSTLARNFRQVLADVARGDDSLNDAPDPSQYSIPTEKMYNDLDMDMPLMPYVSKRMFGNPDSLGTFASRLADRLGLDNNGKEFKQEALEDLPDPTPVPAPVQSNE